MTAVLTALLLLTGAMSCGGEDAPDDFVYTPRPKDLGPMSDRVRIAQLFEELKDAFHDRDTEAFCKRLNTEEGAANLGGATGRCEDVVAETADAVEDGDFKWRNRRIISISSYGATANTPDTIGGVMATRPPRGPDDFRLQFIKRDGEWKADFAGVYELPILTAR